MLRLESLSKVYGADVAAAMSSLENGASKSELLQNSGHAVGVFDVSLRIEPGELFVVMGLSGSGKSTLLRMINRLIEPSAGRVFFDDVDVTAMSRRDLVELRRHHMSMVFQSFALLPHLNIVDNVAFGLRARGVDKRTAHKSSTEALELVGIPEVANQFPHQLSGGMQQRVGLARAWVTDSEVTLMDEAFSALDPLIRAEMQEALLTLQRNNKRTILFISHDLNEAFRIGDRMAIMADGEIRQVGTPKEIIRSPADDYVQSFVKDAQTGRVFTAHDIAESGLGEDKTNAIPSDTLLEDIIPLAVDREMPIPVTNKDGTLVGHITHTRLLRSLSENVLA